MSADSNIPVLGRIAAAIHPNPHHYASGRDYYGSPVHTALGRPLTDDSWPKIRKEYLLDEHGKLTAFPHNYKSLEAKKSDLPITFFYEIIRLLQTTEATWEAFPGQCVNYYNAEFARSAAKKIRNHARRSFFHCYAFLLGQEIVKNNITVDQLRPISNSLPADKIITQAQHEYYMKTFYRIYCKSSKEPFYENTGHRFKDLEGFNKNPILSGPRFMTNIFGLWFSYNSTDERVTRLNMDTGVDFRKEDFLKETQYRESRKQEALDFEKGSCKGAATLFIFCAAAERAILEKGCCSPLAKKEETFRTGLSNLLRDTSMLETQRIHQIVDEIIEAIRNEKDGSSTRFQANSLFNDIQAFINDAAPDDPDSIDERGSLHLVIPNESRSLPNSVIELKFHFFDINKQELSFHYIESYDCQDEFGEPANGYYFIPGSDSSLLENDYLSCWIKVGTTLDPGDETTAHVVVVLYKP